MTGIETIRYGGCPFIMDVISDFAAMQSKNKKRLGTSLDREELSC